jgi:hypothetical protein
LPVPGAPCTHRGGQVGADDHVLLRLNRRDDVAHRPDARTFDLLLKEPGVLLPGALAEPLVLERGDPALLEPEPPAQPDPHRRGRRGAVERQADRGPPVDDQRLAILVGHVPAADVEGGAALNMVGFVVEPAEEQRHARVVLEGLHPRVQGGLQHQLAHPVARG